MRSRGRLVTFPLVCLLMGTATSADAAGGSIAGTVSAGGSPVADVMVVASSTAGGAVAGRTTTGSDGKYVLVVADGTYHVSFEPSDASPYAKQVYQSRSSVIGATPVTVAGAAVTGIDAQLVTGYRIRGTTLDAFTGAGLVGVTVQAYHVEGPTGNYICCYSAGTVTSGAGGAYSVKVAPGKYRVTFSASGYPTQWWPKLNISSTSAGHLAARDITVGLADTTVIDATLGASGVQRSCFDPAITPTTTVYLPNITRTLGGASGWVTPFIVQNVGSAGTALEASFYRFSDGSRVTCRRIDNLQPGTSFADVPNEDTDLPDNAQFSVVVRSFGSTVVSVVNEHQGSGARAEALSYVGPSSGATAAYLPYLSKSKGDWLTTFIVQNLGAATASVTISLRSLDGARTATLTRSIAPGRSAAIDPTVEDAIMRFDELSAVVTGSQPIAVVVNAHNDAATVAAPKGYSYNGLGLSTAATAYMPYLMKEDLEAFGPGIGQVYLQNMGAADAAPTLTFRKLGSATATTITAPAPVKPGATWAFDPQIYKVVGGFQLCKNAGAGKCIDPGEHSLVVTGGSFAVLNAMIASATAMGVVGTPTTAAKHYLPNVTRTLGGTSGWSTPIVVQSAGATTATVKWYRFADGTLVHTQTLTGLSTGVSQQIDPRSVSALVDATQYAVVVEGDGQLTALVRELNFQGGDGSMGYEGFGATP
jgi:hypothetical protein